MKNSILVGSVLVHPAKDRLLRKIIERKIDFLTKRKMAEFMLLDNRFSEESDVESNHKMDDEINGEEKWQCCSKTFSNTRSLKAHYSNW